MPDPANFQFPNNQTSAVTSNASARPDCYTAPGTLRNVTNATSPDSAHPAKSGNAVGLGNTRRFYADDGVAEKDTA